MPPPARPILDALSEAATLLGRDRTGGLGVQFEMELPEGKAPNENDPALKAMKEAARQLGLTFEVGEQP
ncbi:MAG TPA: hypothetical protein VNK92_03495 [Vicinamibacterales bacterium]|nr:hypothetical protein [Vicinamibacterales bacterium]